MPEFEAIVPQKLENATVDFGAGPGSELSFNFDVNKVTPLWFDELRRRGEEEQDVLSLAEALATVIVSWNLTVAGEATPPSKATLARFPIKHLLALLDAVAEVPTRAEGEVSSERSSGSPPEASMASTPPQPEKQPTPLNGADTSRSPMPSASPSPT